MKSKVFKWWNFPMNMNHRIPIKGIGRVTRVINRMLWYVRIRQLRRQGVSRVALASYPRSGNTWVRYLLEAATGEETGSIYSRPDGALPRGPEGVAIKTHQFDSYRYTRAIHVVRNPFDAIDSYFKYEKDVMGKDLNWSEFVSGRGIRGWRKHILHWLSAPIDTLLIRFEDIKADTEGQLANVMNWLGFEISDEKIRIAVEQCTIDKLRRKSTHGGNKFFRKGQIGKGIENFTAAQKSLVIENLAPLLERFGYDGVL